MKWIYHLLPQLLDDCPFTSPVEFSRGVNRNDRPFIDGKEYFPLRVRSTTLFLRSYACCFLTEWLSSGKECILAADKMIARGRGRVQRPRTLAREREWIERIPARTSVSVTYIYIYTYTLPVPLLIPSYLILIILYIATNPRNYA